MKRHLVWIIILAVSLLVSAFGEAEPALPPLIKTLMQGKDTAARMDAAKKLGQSGDSQAASPLIKALKDENKAVRWAAIEALGELRARAAVPALLAYLEKKEAYRWGKILTANALAAIKDPKTVKPLLALLEKHENPIIQRVIILALGKLGDARAIPAALELLKDERRWMRKAAQASLVDLAKGRLQGKPPRGYKSWAKWYKNDRKRHANRRRKR
ncbi:MAG: HEAT repeat domain-containing protein [Dehalococcoidia bacterium]